MEKLSVLMPVYNREDFVGQAIESILKQTHPAFDFIIYDDGSKDDTKKVIQNYLADRRIRFLGGRKNQGVAHARNQLLQACQTRFACWQDSDDISNIHRLEQQGAAMTEKKMVFTQWLRFNTGSPVPWESKPSAGRMEDWSSPTAMFPMDKGCRFDESFKLDGEDWDWIGRMTRKIKKIMLPQCLYYYRNHGNRLCVIRQEIEKHLNPDEQRSLAYGEMAERLPKKGAGPKIAAIALPAVKASFHYSLEEFLDGKKEIVIKGWAYPQKRDARGSRIYLALVTAGGYKSFVFETAAVPRPDVTAFFKAGFLDESGFDFQLSKGRLPIGVYRVGILIQSKGKKYFQLTDKICEVGK